MKRGLVKSIEQNNRFLKFGPFDSRVLLKDFPVPSFCPLLSKGIFSFQIWMADLGAGAVAQSLSHTQPGCCESRYRASLRAAMYAENLAWSSQEPAWGSPCRPALLSSSLWPTEPTWPLPPHLYPPVRHPRLPILHLEECFQSSSSPGKI